MNSYIKDKLQLNPIFTEIYCFLVSAIVLLCWTFSFTTGVIILAVLSLAVFLLTLDTRLFIPLMLNMIFLINKEFTWDATKPPVLLLVCGFILFAILVSFTVYPIIECIKGKKKFTFGKHFKPFVMYTILAMIPIFWNHATSESSYLLIFYFAWIGYTLLYVLFSNGSKHNNMDILLQSFTYIPLLLMGECMITTYRHFGGFEHLMTFGVDMGWGIGNEAGIILFFIVPFLFYRFIKGKLFERIVSVISILGSITAIIYTFSRGGYLMMPIEIVVCLVSFIIYLRFFRPKDRHIDKDTVIAAILIFVFLAFVITATTLSGLLENVFGTENPFGTSGRFEWLYPEAWSNFTSSVRNFFFGSGFISRIDSGNRLIVYHSTLFETLSMTGLFGTIMLGLHLYYKYQYPFKHLGLLSIFTLISYLCVDCYGMLDNTYHMYYYMIFLMVFISTFENYNKELEA